MSAATVVLRLEGPVQGWGNAESRWDFRATGLRPTKSGVVGLVANALGRTYDDPIDDLAALKFGVRADRPGHVELDYRSAGGGSFPLDTRTVQEAEQAGVSKIATNLIGRNVRYGAPRGAADWSEAGRGTVLRHQTLLVDAAFLVALTGPESLAAEVERAASNPARVLSLGRRANPPAHEVGYALLNGDRHSTWFDSIPLLPSGTDPTPQVWLEEFSEAGIVSHEQPTNGQRRGGAKAGLSLVSRHATPPAMKEHAA